MWVIMGPILHMYYSDIQSGYLGADEHNHLIEALGRRDPAAARAAIEQDILRAGQSIADALTPSDNAKLA
jgi:GntR family transcriptional regulator, colanic acid and biofilm gene transcriptional regulator